MGGIAIIEVYGEKSRECIQRSLKVAKNANFSPERAHLGILKSEDGTPLDDVVVSQVDSHLSWCSLPHYSIGCHGGVTITEEILDLFVRKGARQVTMEELLDLGRQAGRLDPFAPEAYPLLLKAKTERAALYFHQIIQGALTESLRDLLSAFLEKRLDRQQLLDAMEAQLQASSQAIRLGEPLRILLAGIPNAGKSTLFNALVGEERVVVSPKAGTTRDLIEELGEIEGYPILWMDSAGIREEGEIDPVEQAGIAKVKATECDALLWLCDPEGSSDSWKPFRSNEQPRCVWMPIWTKSDQDSPVRSRSDGELQVSALKGEGLRELKLKILKHWLGPQNEQDLAPLPFTQTLRDKYSHLFQRIKLNEVDDVQAAFIECFGFSANFPFD